MSSGRPTASRVKASQLSRVILCYSRHDQAAALRIADGLTDRGFAVQLDAARLPHDEWLDRLKEMISAADSVVYLISPSSVTSELCNFELATAHELNKKIVPVVIEPVASGSVPESISRLNFVFLDQPERYEDALNHIAAALQTDIEWLRQHTRLSEQAQLWLARGRNPDYLLRGTAVAEAKQWLADRPADAVAPTKLCLDYITESERHDATPAQSRKSLFYSPKPRGPRVFISYRRADASQTAGRIFDRLRSEIPEDEIVFDVNSIPIGVDFKEHIRGSMQACAVVLAIIGKSWIKRQWSWPRWWPWTPSEDFVETEIRLAFEYGVPIIPILIENAEMPKRPSLPSSIVELVTLNASPVRPGRDFHADMDQVLARIRPLRMEGVAVKRG